MMSNPFKDSFDQISQEISASVAAGDVQTEIESRGAKAAKHLLKFQFKEAASELGKVADLVSQKGQITNAATAKFAQARAYAQMDNGTADALEACHAALDLVAQVDDWQLLGEIALLKTYLHILEEDFPAALHTVNQIIAIYAEEPVPVVKVVHAHRLRGGIGLFLLLFEQAKQDFDIALSLATQMEDSDLIDDIQRQLDMVDVFAMGELTADDLLYLFGKMSENRPKEILTEPDLLKAIEKLGQKKVVAAKKLAQQSHTQSRQDDSIGGYMRYLLSSVVLAECYAAADEKVDVLKTMLPCKVYIEQKFSPAAGLFVDQYLNSFQERWGADTLQQTIFEYQAWVAKNGPIQA